MGQQQLVARIKRSSKYSHQAPPEGWFTVTIVDDRLSRIRGNNNNYSLSDVALGVMVDGVVVELATGKAISTDVAGLRQHAA